MCVGVVCHLAVRPYCDAGTWYWACCTSRRRRPAAVSRAEGSCSTRSSMIQAQWNPCRRWPSLPSGEQTEEPTTRARRQAAAQTLTSRAFECRGCAQCLLDLTPRRASGQQAKPSFAPPRDPAPPIPIIYHNGDLCCPCVVRPFFVLCGRAAGARRGAAGASVLGPVPHAPQAVGRAPPAMCGYFCAPLGTAHLHRIVSYPLPALCRTLTQSCQLAVV